MRSAAFEWVPGPDDRIAVAVAVAGVVASVLGIAAPPPPPPPSLFATDILLLCILVLPLSSSSSSSSLFPPQLGDDYDIAMMCLPP